MAGQGKTELAGQVVQATPSLGAIYLWVAGVPVEKWAAVAGLVFIAVQVVGYLWRLRRDMRHEQERVDAIRASRMPGDEP